VPVRRACLPGGDHSADPAISADGRVVSFFAQARGVVPGGTGLSSQMCVRDTHRGTTPPRRQRDDRRGTRRGHRSRQNLAHRAVRHLQHERRCRPGPGGTEGTYKVFLRDMRTGRITQLSRGVDGRQPDGGSYGGKISDRGATSPSPRRRTTSPRDPRNPKSDGEAFPLDRRTGTVRRTSKTPDGAYPNGLPGVTDVSAEGLDVAFHSNATNLTPHDTDTFDAYVADAFAPF